MLHPYPLRISQHSPHYFSAVPLSVLLDVSESSRNQVCGVRGVRWQGLQWLAGLYRQGFNGILADEMVRDSHTLQAAQAIFYPKPPCNRAMIDTLSVQRAEQL